MTDSIYNHTLGEIQDPLERATSNIQFYFHDLKHFGGKAAGLRTIAKSTRKINKVTNEFDMVTEDHLGNTFEWSYTETIPHIKTAPSLQRQEKK